MLKLKLHSELNDIIIAIFCERFINNDANNKNAFRDRV